jgi:hypothetical protein
MKEVRASGRLCGLEFVVFHRGARLRSLKKGVISSNTIFSGVQVFFTSDSTPFNTKADTKL